MNNRTHLKMDHRRRSRSEMLHFPGFTIVKAFSNEFNPARQEYENLYNNETVNYTYSLTYAMIITCVAVIEAKVSPLIAILP